jgi:hypothetical protein
VSSIFLACENKFEFKKIAKKLEISNKLFIYYIKINKFKIAKTKFNKIIENCENKLLKIIENCENKIAKNN